MQLVQKGQSIILKQKGEMCGAFHAKLKWKTAVDLDLHCFFRLREMPKQPKGFFGKLGSKITGAGKQKGHIYYGQKGGWDRSPWITLDKDAGVGDVGGDNEENMHFWDIDKIEHAIIVANIYSKNTNFAQYQGKVIVEGGGQKFEIPLTETRTGSWCVVARIDNSDETPQLINVNRTQTSTPNLEEFIR